MRRHEKRLAKTVVLAVIVVLVVWWSDLLGLGDEDDDNIDERDHDFMKKIAEDQAADSVEKAAVPPAPPVSIVDRKNCRKDLYEHVVRAAASLPALQDSTSPPACLQDRKEDDIVLRRNHLSLYPQNDDFLPQSLGDLHSRSFPLGLPAAPGNSPSTVHYVWCRGKEYFRFEDYVGLLSAIKLLEPNKIVFHYQNDLPGQVE